MRLTDKMIGNRYNRLTILSVAGIGKKRSKIYECECDCGNKTLAYGYDLKSGHKKSCGCLKIESLNQAKHNKRHTRLYTIWSNMKTRCYNKHNYDYKNYGGRGINVCKHWVDSFEAFYNWAINNGYEENLTLDRIDNNGNYEPNNCRWTTRKKQSVNRRTNVIVEYEKERYVLKELTDKLELPYEVIRERIKRYNWDIDKAIATPVKR